MTISKVSDYVSQLKYRHAVPNVNYEKINVLHVWYCVIKKVKEILQNTILKKQYYAYILDTLYNDLDNVIISDRQTGLDMTIVMLLFFFSFLIDFSAMKRANCHIVSFVQYMYVQYVLYVV